MGRKAAAVVAAMAVALTACTSTDPSASTSASPSASASAAPKPTTVRIAVYGADPVLAAYDNIVASFGAQHPDVKVTLQGFAAHGDAMAAINKAVGSKTAFDLFLVTEADLVGLRERKMIAPVDELLGARGLNFGDGFERGALERFSADAHLQCLPTEISPMVVYYNPALVKLRTLVPSGAEIPSADAGWTFHQFARAARRAANGQVRGIEVARDLDHLAPFILAGGSDVVDDQKNPTTLTLNSAEALRALRPLSKLLRNPRRAFTGEQLARKGATQRFIDGELAMLVGDRSLTPVLRNQKGFIFGTMPMPRMARSATTATISGACLAAPSAQNSGAADLLAYLGGDDAAAALAATGYVVPTNVNVLRSDQFLQPGQGPRGALAFSGQMRSVRNLPIGQAWDLVVKGTQPGLAHLLSTSTEPLRPRLRRLDALSATLFAEAAK